METPNLSRTVFFPGKHHPVLAVHAKMQCWYLEIITAAMCTHESIDAMYDYHLGQHNLP